MHSESSTKNSDSKQALEICHASSRSPGVPLKTKIAWGVGVLADGYIMAMLGALAMPIYNIEFGLDPVKLGVALFVARFLDAIANPFMGYISDNTRSRWGRRRPYLMVGAVLSAIILPFLWTPPFTSQAGMFWYFMPIALIYVLSYTMYSVPYTALGYELTTDYDERTRTLVWRQYIGLVCAMTCVWLYKFCLLPIFGGDAAKGAFYVSIVIGIIIIMAGLSPTMFCRETQWKKNERIGIIKSITCTVKNRAFMRLLAANTTINFGLFSGGALWIYVNIYYVCDGDKSFAATLCGLNGTVTFLTAYLSLPLITFISVRTGKREAMIAGLLLGLLGFGSLWFTMTPNMPYLQLVSCFIMGLGMQGCCLMGSSMIADLCDEDELKTGLRREGFYGAVDAFALKLTISLMVLVAGIMLKIAGYEAISAEKASFVGPDVVFKLRVLFIGTQCVALAMGIVMFLFYPISRSRAHQTRCILEERHKKDSCHQATDNVENGCKF